MTVEFKQPVGGLARDGAGGDRATREEGGFATRKWWGSCVLLPIERARPSFSLIRSPRAHPGGAGDGLGSPDGLRAYSGGNEEPGAQLDRITPSRRKKTPTIDLVGETAGDALSSLMGFCCTKLIHTADLLAIKG
jgi:hypothetical protein